MSNTNAPTVDLTTASTAALVVELQRRGALPRGRGRPVTTEAGATAALAGLLRRPVGRPRTAPVTV